MNDDVVASVEGKSGALPLTEIAVEERERSLVLLLEALEGRLATPEYQEVLRILGPANPDRPERGSGRG